MNTVTKAEKDLYEPVQKYLIEEKGCIADYTGNELFLKRGKIRIRADVYGISNDAKKSIFLCEGKKEIKYRSFGKVIGEAIEDQLYGDYVYVFGPSDGFEKDETDYIEKSEGLGIGVLLVNPLTSEVQEYIEPKPNPVKDSNRKETMLRVYLKEINRPISNLIFQGAHELITKNRDVSQELSCIRYCDVYQSIFKDEKTKELFRKIMGHHTLIDRDVRKEFQRRYGKSGLVDIERADDILRDFIYFTDEGLERGRPPILLSAINEEWI